MQTKKTRAHVSGYVAFSTVSSEESVSKSLLTRSALSSDTWTLSVCNNAKRGSEEGTNYRVRNKPKKKTRFKGKRLADTRNDGENNGSQSTSFESANSPDLVVNREELSTVKSTSARKLESANLEASTTPEFDGVTTRHSLQEEEQDGYRIVYIESIRKSVEIMHKCKSGT